MKRLLAYLFIVLGLGLTFNVNAYAKGFYPKYHSKHPEKIFFSKCRGTGEKCPINTKTHKNIYKYVKKNLKKDEKGLCRYEPKERRGNQVVYKGKTVCDKIYIDRKKLQVILKGTNLEELVYFHSAEYWEDKRKELDIKFAKREEEIKKKEIIKKEPSQTQKVAKLNGIDITNTAWILDSRLFVLFLKNGKCRINERGLDVIIKNISYEGAWERYCKYEKHLDNRVELKLGNETNPTKYNLAFFENKFIGSKAKFGLNVFKEVLNGKKPKGIYIQGVKKELTATQIAKIEPSQTQKVAKKEILLQSLSDKTSFIESEYLKWKKQKKGWKIYKVIHLDTNKIYEGSGISDSRTGYIIGKESAFLLCSYSLEGQRNPDGCQNYDYHKQKKIKTVNKEPIIKPKKKVKVAKVEEPKQEEFKPKKTNQDNEAPVINIAEAITVNDTSYILEGRVTDKADKIFVEIDGQPVQVKKGKFKVKRYSPVDEQIKIVAIDQWGNKSKTKLVNITIDIDETIVANKLEPLNPSNILNKSSNNKVALIIGIENYTEAPKANYANLDAKYFFDYARRAFGVKKQNINLLVNEEATVVKTDKAVSLWLKSKIKKNKSDLIIFFAGHGLASSDGKELYLLPQDGNPDRLERTALSRTDLFKEIISLNPKSVTMFLDTCYSGVSRDEQMLLASARPIRIVADEQEGIPDNFTIFSASQLDQISSGLKEANHGIFSYYLMKGMEGNADINKDKKITNGELLAYMDENVSQKASELGRQQNPSLAGDPNKVLMSYR